MAGRTAALSRGRFIAPNFAEESFRGKIKFVQSSENGGKHFASCKIVVE
jgi:hypothetical protein